MLSRFCMCSKETEEGPCNSQTTPWKVAEDQEDGFLMQQDHSEVGVAPLDTQRCTRSQQALDMRTSSFGVSQQNCSLIGHIHQREKKRCERLPWFDGQKKKMEPKLCHRAPDDYGVKCPHIP